VAGGRLLTPGTAPAAPDADAVLILPLENRTGDAGLDAMGSWAADWITQGLGRVHGLRVVVAGAGLPAGAGAAPDGDQLRRLLNQTGAGVVLSGAYYRFGDSIQFQVRITDASGRTAVRAPEPVRGSLAEPHAAVGELAERVTGALAAHRHPFIQAVNADGSTPPSWEAYQAWTDGLVQFGRRDFGAAGIHFLHAASLDSSFMSPLIWAAGARSNLGDHIVADSLLRIADRRRSRILPFDRHLLDMWLAIMRGDLLESYRAALRLLDTAPASELALFLAANRAITINHPGKAVEYAGRIRVDSSAVDWDTYGTRLTEALHLLGDHNRELEEAQRVRRRRPELLRAHGDEIRALAALGRGQEVLLQLDRLMALAPQPRVTPASIAVMAADELRVHGDEVAADAALERALAWYGARPAEEQTTAAHRHALGHALYQARRWQEAEHIFRELAGAAPGQVSFTGRLGVIYAHTGRPVEAEQEAAALAAVSPTYPWGRATLWRARIAAALGRQEDAVALVQSALAQGEPHGLYLHANPDLAPLRAVPAYREIMTPVR
jgi:tetratricopeptide (TPR) repeat protein/TolB-like protein